MSKATKSKSTAELQQARQAPLPSSTPGQPYSGVITDAAFMPGQDGVGLMWIIKVWEPTEHAGLDLAHMSLFDPARPSTFADTTGELSNAGLTLDQIYSGDVPQLLRGRLVQFNYTAPDDVGTREALEIVGLVAAPVPVG